VAEGAGVAFVRARRTVIAAEIYKEMGEVDPFVFRDDLHEILFYFYGVFGVGQS